MRCKTPEAVQELVNDYRHDTNELVKHITQILWYMRGGVTREEAWRLSPQERKHISKLIDERIKLVEKTHLPIL